ncbi:thermonuclease family protein [Thiocystis violacea]|uniref:thermonuclease family protein n=1 Tax=Thiocystis violacea TaxID=13725 RepID=UPI001F5BF988|nr:thermonuclease family protein [Thiocystis violacea]
MRNLFRSSIGSGAITLILLTAWGIDRWGGGLIPAGWSLGAGGRSCRLEKVLDGDSLRLVCQGKPVEVRLYCIDAPEKNQRPWGDRSRAHLRDMAPRELRLVTIDRDRYGRTVGEVYTLDPEPRLLNLEQVRAGQAAVYERYCDDSRYSRAQREARGAKRGIWSRRGEHQTPWTFRQRRS